MTKIRSEQGVIIGDVVGDEFRKTIQGSIHIFRLIRSLANDIVSLHQAEAAGATWCVIIDTEDGQVYYARIALIWENGFNMRDYGCGNQIGSQIKYWSKTKDEQSRLFEI